MAPPICKHFAQQLSISVQKGDGSVRTWVGSCACAFVDENDSSQQLGGGQRACSGVMECLEEYVEQWLPQDGPELLQDLVGYPIAARLLRSRHALQRVCQFLKGEGLLPLAFSRCFLGKTGVNGGKQFGLGMGIRGPLCK